MKLIEMKPAIPIGKATFRKHVLRSFLIQALFAFCIFIFMSIFKFSILEPSTFYYLIFITILNSILIFYVFDYTKYRARFKDIFPEQDLNPFLYLLVGMMPIGFILGSVILCLKNSAETRKFPCVLKLRYVFIPLIVFLLIQLCSPVFSYWTATPSVFFAVDTAYDSMNIVQLKNNAVYRENYNVLNEYQSSSDKLSSTEIVLLVAVNATVIIKEKNRTIASGTNNDEVGIRAALHMLNTCYLSLLKSESRVFEFLDYSPIQWIHPSGPIEILLLSMVEQQIQLRFNKVLLQKSMDILNGIEKKDMEISLAQKEIYLKEILELKKKFETTKTFLALSQVN